jgi:hypothetical protein
MSVVIEALDTNRDAVLKFIASRNEIALQSNGALRLGGAQLSQLISRRLPRQGFPHRRA